ncbi:hypothetical protein [Pyrococcus horikoshii]|uniref:Uncharacterized protein n=1 Tax=Pyrococcus horikoshii TaxID=53953 RepID=A0A832T5W3_PYRHR|nr:hypothetical protein [Pyrococcus horikoshii]HII61006.1 hypothetical protein [Pyrococcus horikoshii]
MGQRIRGEIIKYLSDTKAFFNDEDGSEFVEKLLKEVDKSSRWLYSSLVLGGFGARNERDV